MTGPLVTTWPAARRSAWSERAGSERVGERLARVGQPVGHRARIGSGELADGAGDRLRAALPDPVEPLDVAVGLPRGAPALELQVADPGRGKVGVFHLAAEDGVEPGRD